jgi:hypothetical protein
MEMEQVKTALLNNDPYMTGDSGNSMDEFTPFTPINHSPFEMTKVVPI